MSRYYEVDNAPIPTMNLREKTAVLPKNIQERIAELDEIIEMYPKKIPVTTAAKFLGMDVECMRRGIEQGKFPFALGCDNDIYGNRYAYISSVTFYLWFLSPIII